jgi:hypothetical protein
VKSHFGRGAIKVTVTSIAAWSLRSARIISMDTVQEYSDDGRDSAMEWNGDVPEDIYPWMKSLHGLITRAFCDAFVCGGEPEWWCSCDGEFVEAEEDRRELHVDR